MSRYKHFTFRNIFIIYICIHIFQNYTHLPNLVSNHHGHSNALGSSSQVQLPPTKLPSAKALGFKNMGGNQLPSYHGNGKSTTGEYYLLTIDVSFYTLYYKVYVHQYVRLFLQVYIIVHDIFCVIKMFIFLKHWANDINSKDFVNKINPSPPPPNNI